MKIIWHGHSCFTIETKDGTIVIDPYRDDSVPGLPPLRLSADLVICSHEHADHGAKEIVTVSGRQINTVITQLSTFHDDVQGAKRGPNVITIISEDGVRIVHMGDIGCMPTDKQFEVLKGADVLLLPVGGYFTVEPETAKEIADRIGAKTVIPMHYRTEKAGYPVIAPPEEYLKLCGDVVFLDSNEVTVTKDMPKQTLMLKHPAY